MLHREALSETSFVFAAVAGVAALAGAVACRLLLNGRHRQSRPYGALFAAHPAPMLMVDPVGQRVMDVNAAAAAVLGGAAGNTHNRACADVDPALSALFDDTSTSDGVRSGPTGTAPQGVWMLSEPMSYDGRPVRIATLMGESALPALLEADRRFHRAIENSPAPTLFHAEDGEILAISDSWLEATGYTRGELRTIDDWVARAYGSDADLARARIARTYDFQTRKELGEITVTCRDGTTRIWTFSAVSIGRLPDGRRVAISVAFDITAMRKAEQQLREREALFRNLTEQALIGVYLIDSGRFTYVNPRLEDIFGYDSGELDGTPVKGLVSRKDWPKVQRLMQERLDGRRKEARYEFIGRTKQGADITVGVHGSATEFGGKRQIIGVLQDITERTRNEEAVAGYLAQLEASLTATVRTVSQLVELRDPYTSGHELRVADLAAAIAGEMGLDADVQRGLRVAGALHDVGKIGVPVEILTKPSRLSDVEFALVQSHTTMGYEVLRNIDFPWPVADVAHQHHERLDGSGYPLGLAGPAIGLEGRITAVADVVEAMSSHRPYRAGLGVVAALDEIEANRRKLYDAEAVDACLRLFRDKGYEMPEAKPGALVDMAFGSDR